jgi:hypothetical protein
MVQVGDEHRPLSSRQDGGNGALRIRFRPDPIRIAGHKYRLVPIGTHGNHRDTGHGAADMPHVRDIHSGSLDVVECDISEEVSSDMPRQ